MCIRHTDKAQLSTTHSEY